MTLALLLSACGGGGSTPAPAGDAGGDATPPADSPATMSGAIPADILRTCSFTNACSFGPVVGAPIDRCFENLSRFRLQGSVGSGAVERQQVERLARCAMTSTSCDAFTRCGRMETAACTAMGGRCEAQVAVSCSFRTDNVPTVIDCAALGLPCSAGQCVPPAGAPACDPATAAARCDGNTIVRCGMRAGGGAEVREPCPTGAECVATGSASSPAVCVPAQVGACTAPGSRCDGSTLIQCLPVPGGLRELRQSCGSVGMGCGTVAGGGSSPQCIPAGTQCTAPPRTTTMPSSNRCDGADIVACVGGYTTRIRCADFGRMSCATVTPFAICQ